MPGAEAVQVCGHNSDCQFTDGLCYVFIIRHWTILSFCLIFPYLDLLPLSLADHIGLPRSFLLSLITLIFNCPWHYPVAVSLLLYQWLCLYLVQYIDPQSSVTVDLDYAPLP